MSLDKNGNVIEKRTRTGTAPKNDNGKIRYEFIPVAPLREIAMVLTFGAKKYNHNAYSDSRYRGGLEWSRYYGAILRHVFAWWGGEQNDPESGLHHLAHAACCILFLMHFEDIHPELDDRDIQYDLPFIDGTAAFDEEKQEKKSDV